MEIVEEKASFMDDSGEDEFFAEDIKREFDPMSRGILEPPVKRPSECAVFIKFRGTVGLQPATGDEFIEAAEPTETIRLIERDISRIDGAGDRRIPAYADGFTG